VPIRFRGRSLGTMNICAEAGRFTNADRAPGQLLAGLLVPSLLADLASLQPEQKTPPPPGD
jgi:hypothetical protein